MKAKIHLFIGKYSILFLVLLLLLTTAPIIAMAFFSLSGWYALMSWLITALLWRIYYSSLLSFVFSWHSLNPDRIEFYLLKYPDLQRKPRSALFRILSDHTISERERTVLERYQNQVNQMEVK